MWRLLPPGPATGAVHGAVTTHPVAARVPRVGSGFGMAVVIPAPAAIMDIMAMAAAAIMAVDLTVAVTTAADLMVVAAADMAGIEPSSSHAAMMNAELTLPDFRRTIAHGK